MATRYHRRISQISGPEDGVFPGVFRDPIKLFGAKFEICRCKRLLLGPQGSHKGPRRGHHLAKKLSRMRKRCLLEFF